MSMSASFAEPCSIADFWVTLRTEQKWGDRLIGYGISLHLIKGTPVREPRPINPSDDHTSFQVRPQLPSFSALYHCDYSWLSS